MSVKCLVVLAYHSVNPSNQRDGKERGILEHPQRHKSSGLHNILLYDVSAVTPQLLPLDITTYHKTQEQQA